MKRLFLALLLAMLTACAATPLLDQETNAVRAVTLLRQTSAAELRAGKITVAQEQRNKAIFDGMVASIKAAVGANDPAGVQAQKAAAEKFDVVKGQ